MAKSKDDPIGDVIRAARESGNPDRFLAEATVRAAQRGDSGAARDVLETFADEVDRHSARAWESIERAPRYYCQARYLADCFRAILAGGDPKAALNLKKPQGRQSGKAIFPPHVLAAMFHFVVRRGLSAFKAKQEIAARMGIDAKTVQRAADEWDFRRTRDEDLKADFRPYARVVTKILSGQ